MREDHEDLPEAVSYGAAMGGEDEENSMERLEEQHYKRASVSKKERKRKEAKQRGREERALFGGGEF